MKKTLFIASYILASCLGLQAQISWNDPLLQRQAEAYMARVNFATAEAPAEEQMISYFKQQLPQLRRENSGLLLQSKVKSPLGWHYTFCQTLYGKPLWGTELKVNTDNRKQLISAFYYLQDCPLPPGAVSEATHYYYNGAELFAARLEQHGQVLELKDMNARLLYREDLNKYAGPVDSNVQARVFNPDPLSSAQKAYKSPYVDSSDQNSPALEAELRLVSLPVTWDGDSFALVNKHFKVQEFSAPITWPTHSKTPAFFFNRSEKGFEDVNAYYHLNRQRMHIDSLGYGSLSNDTIWVDAHALGNADLSMFSTYDGHPALFFGEGGVDDAEDADVIVHEYTHSVISKATTTSNLSNERASMDEAICDYMACAYSRRITDFEWKKVFNWDGNNAAANWFGRNAGNPSKQYPYDNAQNIYWNSEILSGTLTDMSDLLNDPRLVEKLLLQALYGMSNSATMKQICTLMLQADSMMYQKAHYYPIQQAFFGRKVITELVSAPDVPAAGRFSLLSSYDFASGQAPLTIVAPVPASFTVDVYDLAGRLIQSQKGEQGRLQLFPADFGKGVYLLHVQQNGEQATLKIIR